MKKTMAISISRGMMVRNFLKNEFYRILREQYNIILFTTVIDKEFIEEFSHPNITFVQIHDYQWGFIEGIFVKLHKMLMFGDSVALFARYGIPNMVRKNKLAPFRYFLFFLLFKPLSKIQFLKELVRAFDAHFLQRDMVKAFVKVLKDKNASLVISLNLFSDTEVALIKAAKRLNITAWAMPKSWDNLGNYGLRIKPDRFLVWNEFMKNQAEILHHVDPNTIDIFEPIQFDSYLRSERIIHREDFCTMMDLDPKKKIIVFGTEGKLMVTDPDIVDILQKFVISDKILFPSQILVRPHFGYKDEEKRFLHLQGKQGIIIDTYVNRSQFRDNWDYSDTFLNRFINTMYHADIIINTVSSLSLDASVYDKPIISISFDGYKQNVKFADSVRFWYHTDHAKELIRTGALTVVYSQGELQEAINSYLNDPYLLKQNRIALLQHLGGQRIDGYAGKRLAEKVKEQMGQ